MAVLISTVALIMEFSALQYMGGIVCFRQKPMGILLNQLLLILVSLFLHNKYGGCC
jgi:hypothetical protein